MRFKPRPVEISAEEPFKNDALERKESAEILTQFLECTSTPFVLSIDSPWGTGKTTFLEMWIHLLTKAGFKHLFFNAWENDFSDSPLVSLIGEVGASIDHLALTDGKKLQAVEAFEKTKKIAAKLVKAALPTAVKLATSGLLDLTALKDADLGEITEEMVKKQIEKYQKDKESIKGFRESLAKFVSTISKNQEAETPTKPVIFIIDELDRCRPDYAIQLLEKVKHLFSVQGLVFVLAMDMEQLGESIKSVYGDGFQADGYLRRFVDLRYRLPTPEPNRFVRALYSRFDLHEAFNVRNPQLHDEEGQLVTVLGKLFPLFGFSLRVQEQCFTLISVAIRTTGQNHPLYPFHLGILVCLRAANRKLYDEYVNGDAGPDKVLDYLGELPGGMVFLDTQIGYIVEASLVIGIREAGMRARTKQAYFNTVNSNDGDTKKKGRAHQVTQLFGSVAIGVEDMTGYVQKKIEIANRFV